MNNLACSIVRKRAATSKGRKRLNNWYNSLDLDGQAVFQNIFCKIYRDYKGAVEDGYWRVDFRGTELKMPLRNEQMWLDWDNALSLLAHDPDVKETYRNLLEDQKVQTFFDVGANYGTHSLLFLSQGIRTVSFEPNSTLNKNFQDLCNLNNLEGKIENFALGDRSGEVVLRFPANATWLGTIMEAEASSLQNSFDLISIKVPIISLDEYIKLNDISPDLIKIDTEGNELGVLKGAGLLLSTKRPLIVFESNTGKDRAEIYSLFKKYNYIICNLPYGGKQQMGGLDTYSFEGSKQFNFVAVPQ